MQLQLLLRLCDCITKVWLLTIESLTNLLFGEEFGQKNVNIFLQRQFRTCRTCRTIEKSMLLQQLLEMTFQKPISTVYAYMIANMMNLWKLGKFTPQGSNISTPGIPGENIQSPEYSTTPLYRLRCLFSGQFQDSIIAICFLQKRCTIVHPFPGFCSLRAARKHGASVRNRRLWRTPGR